MGVGDDLHFHVARTLDESFQHHPAVAEGALGFAARGGERRGHLPRVAHDAHALAAATRHGLDQERKADRLRLAHQPRLRLLRPKVAWHDGHARALHEPLRLILHAHRAHGRGLGSHEGEARRCAGLRKIGRLGEKPVARMHGLRTARARRLNQCRDIEIACRGAGRADAHGHIGNPRVQRTGIRIGVHATARTPSRRAVRAMRQAISPRLAIRSVVNMQRARSELDLKELAADQPAADLVGARADLIELGIAQQPPGRIVVDVADAAQRLDGLERTGRFLGREEDAPAAS